MSRSGAGTTAARVGSLRRRGLWVSAGTAAGSLFATFDYTPLNFAVVDTRIAVVLLVLAALGALGAVLEQRLLLHGVGSVLLLLGAVRLVSYGHGDGLIGGGSSTAALIAGLGVAFIGVAAAANEPAGPQDAVDSPVHPGSPRPRA